MRKNEAKICNKCKKAKALGQFSRDKSKKDGFSTICKECRSKNEKSWREENVEWTKEYNRKYRVKNLEKIKADAKQYYVENKEIVIERSRRYYSQNREVISEKQKDYREKHHERIAKYLADYYQENIDQIREYKKSWSEKNRAKERLRLRTYKRSAKGRAARNKYNKIYRASESGQDADCKYRRGVKRKSTLEKYNSTEKGKITRARVKHRRRVREANIPATLTANEWNIILKLQNNRCGWCNAIFDENNPPERDHIVPVLNGGALAFKNVQALCRSCNSKKGMNIMDFRWWAKGNSDKKLDEQRIALIDKKIDELVYQLYGLTEEEIRLVEGR